MLFVSSVEQDNHRRSRGEAEEKHRRSTGEAGQTQEKLRRSRTYIRTNTREAEEKQKRHKIN